STTKAAGAQLSQLYTPQRVLRSDAEAAGCELIVFGPEPALRGPDGRQISLTRRHAEILLLLHRFPDDISGSGLVERLWPVGGSEVSVRAEINRLRRTIDGIDDLRIDARPYGLRGRIGSDLVCTGEARAQGDTDTARGQNG